MTSTLRKCLFLLLCAPLASHALDNSWTNLTSGHWEDPSWSLGMLPAANQSIIITNAGYKAVGISESTLGGYPQTLTVSNLSISAPSNAISTLLLNYTGLGLPLRVLDGCAINSGGTLMNMYSSLEVDGSAGGSFTISGGQFIQEGGLTMATNVPLGITDGGSLNATNAAMSLGPVSVGVYYGTDGQFNQSGGSIATASLSIYHGDYNLYAGTLYALGGTSLQAGIYGPPPYAVLNQYGGTNFGNIITAGGAYRLLGGLARGNNLLTRPDGFFQGGGEVQTTSLSVGGGNPYSPPGYYLTNGVIRAGALSINSASFLQLGGQASLTNGLSLVGYMQTIPHEGFFVHTAVYTMLGGSLTCGSMTMTQYCTFIQAAGTNIVSGDLVMMQSAYPGPVYQLAGGGLTTDNTLMGSGASFEQLTGTHNVAGLLSINGGYNISGGSLSVGGIWLRGSLSILSNNVPTVSCPGLLDFGGNLRVEVGSHHLGAVRLSADSKLNFGPAAASVTFDSSSSLSWTNGVSLVISNWSGQSPSHVFFGQDSSGLTASQVAQIKFVNPGGRFGGLYNATILNTGEVVPAGVGPLLGGWGGSGYYNPSYSGYSFPDIASNAVAISSRRGNNVVLLANGTAFSSDGAFVGNDLVAVSAGLSHALGLRSNSTVVAWGANYYGESGVPPGLSNVVAVSAGDYHSLALRSDGTIVAWGYNDSSDLSAPPESMPAIAIAAGSYHNLALRADGTVVAWGNNTSGQTNVPAGLSNVVAISGGYFFSLALKADGTVVGWGADYDGQAKPPPGLTNVAAIYAASWQSLALRADGTVVAWGSNAYGETSVPPWLNNVIAIAGGDGYSIALRGGGPQPRAAFSTPVRSNQTFSVSLPTRSGRVYRLEYMTALGQNNWTPLPLVAGRAGSTVLADSSSGSPQRFYRVRQW
jgi:hypothetical protein